MNPILKLHHPFTGVGVLRIFEVTVHDDTMISFLVMVDNLILSFKLFHNGEWNEINTEGVSQLLVIFIRKKIEELYFKQLN